MYRHGRTLGILKKKILKKAKVSIYLIVDTFGSFKSDAKQTTPEPGDNLQMGFKSIMRTDISATK